MVQIEKFSIETRNIKPKRIALKQAENKLSVAAAKLAEADVGKKKVEEMVVVESKVSFDAQLKKVAAHHRQSMKSMGFIFVSIVLAILVLSVIFSTMGPSRMPG